MGKMSKLEKLYIFGSVTGVMVVVLLGIQFFQTLLGKQPQIWIQFWVVENLYFNDVATWIRGHSNDLIVLVWVSIVVFSLWRVFLRHLVDVAPFGHIFLAVSLTTAIPVLAGVESPYTFCYGAVLLFGLSTMKRLAHARTRN